MGSGRKYNATSRTRLKKSNCERRRRDKLHNKRLLALGVPEKTVAKLDAKQRRTLLRKPVKTAAKFKAQ